MILPSEEMIETGVAAAAALPMTDRILRLVALARVAAPSPHSKIVVHALVDLVGRDIAMAFIFMMFPASVPLFHKKFEFESWMQIAFPKGEKVQNGQRQA